MAHHTNEGTTVFALFDPSTALDPVVEKLQKAGVPEEAIDVASPLPLHGVPLRRPHRIPLYVITLIAGVVGIGVGIFFAGGTAVLYPLMTGGKPIVAPPVVGIISFETMMLLAIITTFAAMVIRLRSAHRATALDHPDIDEGFLGISVALNAKDPRTEAVVKLFEQCGAKKVRTDLPHPSLPPAPLLIGSLALLVLSAGGCSKDMEEQVSYQAQEAPRRHSPPGSIPMDSRVIALVPTPMTDERLNEGKRLFSINCAHCHGANGNGDGPVAGYLVELPKNLHASHVQKNSISKLYAIVTDGKDAMPPFKGELSAEERWTVAQYVKSMAKVKAQVEAKVLNPGSIPK